MSPPPKKRPATETAGPTDPKKPRAAPLKTTAVEEEDEEEEEEEEEPVQIATHLNESFSKFPKELREIIEEQYNKHVYRILDMVKTGRPLARYPTFHIMRGVHFGNGKTIYMMAEKEVYPNVAMANVEALEQFIRKAPSLKTRFNKAVAPTIANPRYADINSVRPGHMGWGLDMHGGLSLRLTTVEDNKLKHECIYVEQRGPPADKVKDDDECQIVGDPSVAEA